MDVFKLISLLLMSAFACALANQEADTSINSVLPTSVYVTISSGGALTVVLSKYSQSFASNIYSQTATVASGGVGLGTISGSVGGIKTYSQVTISSSGEANANVYGGVSGLIFVALGLVL